jgi:hypothetical protein
VASCLEIALRVAASMARPRDGEAADGHRSAAVQPTGQQALVAREPAGDPSAMGGVASCGLSHCAGCYQVAPGVRIHPPRCGAGYLEWLTAWEQKGRVQ